MATDGHLAPALPGVPVPIIRGRDSTAPTADFVGPHIAVAGLSKSYGAAHVLQGVDFAIEPGAAVALIGPNGAGKSTLLHCCTRLIEPTVGQVHMLGEDITSMPRRPLRAVRARIGFVFQRHNLVARLSVLSNVLHGAQGRSVGAWFHGLAPGYLRDEAMHCLDLVGLADFAAHRADQLSGGQSQRVAIARALMQQPEIIMADEPAASLDPEAGEEVMRLFDGLTRRQSITRLFTSHNLQHAKDYADRIIALREGIVVLDRQTDEIAPDDLRRLYVAH